MCVPSLLSTNRVPASVGAWRGIAAGLGHRSGALAWLRPGSWPRRATTHSVLCVRWPSFSLGQECTAASFGCQGARKRPGDRGPADAVKRRRARNKMVAGTRESALATAGSPTLYSVGGLATGRPRLASLAPRRAALPWAAWRADCPPSCRQATRLGRVGCCAMGRRVHVSRFGHPRASPRVAVTSPHTHTIKQLAANNATNN